MDLVNSQACFDAHRQHWVKVDEKEVFGEPTELYWCSLEKKQRFLPSDVEDILERAEQAGKSLPVPHIQSPTPPPPVQQVPEFPAGPIEFLPQASRSDMLQHTWFKAAKVGLSIQEYRRRQQEPYRAKQALGRDLLHACPPDHKYQRIRKNVPIPVEGGLGGTRMLHYPINWCATCRKFRFDRAHLAEIRESLG